MEQENAVPDGSELPDLEHAAESQPDLFTTFSVKTLFGFTTTFESAASREETMLKAFQPLHTDINTHADTWHVRNDNDCNDDWENEHCVSSASRRAGPMSGRPTALELELAERNELLLRHLRFVQALSDSDNDDKDAILVQGTLVHTTSDTESDSESKDLGTDENNRSESVLNNAALSAEALDDNNQSKEESESERHSNSDDTVGRADIELHPPNSKQLPKELDGILEHDSNAKDKILMDEQQFSRLLATGECPQELPDEEQRPSADDTSLQKTAPAEKTFQLPAFFSGLRVRKKGLTTEDGETVTEIKPRENDLALLKLRQPVKKSSITSGLATKKKSAEPKASPTFLEQLSHLLNIDVSKNEDRIEDSGEGSGETEDSDEAQENKASGKTEPRFPSEEIKSSPAESALDVFKALFTRPPKKETTADASELEAIKRKMRNEKESLKAVFERSKSKPGDGSADKSPDLSPSEQDDKTPGRLQTVWPPPKAKHEEVKVGLKYTEAEYQAAILHLKREHKEEIETLK
ncbi:PREDICTED: formin-like, partial [Tauraco erythrolophus]|uniref:formin-like n=1 Tax=Tauraco erythrolophus TaxID=121530 RepID=UPI000523D533